MSHLTRFKDAMMAQGFDAAIISSQINQRYLSDFDFQDGLVLVTKGQSYLITDFRYIEAAKAQADADLEVLTPTEGQALCMAGLLSDNACKRVAVEETDLSVATFTKYSDIFGKEIDLVGGASMLLDSLRIVKDEKELATMARAQEITDAAYEHILSWIRPDMTEMEVAMEIEFFMRKNGAEAAAFETIAVSGSNSSRPHGVPRRCKLEKGFLTMDFGARVDGYCSDMTRTIVIGRADDEIKKLYNTVLKAQLAALDALCEGASYFELDRIARDIIDAIPEYKGAFGHSLGHGVGMLIHEDPRVSFAAKPDSVLKRGHVVTIEPGIYLEGKYGCRIEDMICVDNSGNVVDFTKSRKDLIEIC